MLPHLLDPERSLGPYPASPQEETLIEDLGLAPLFEVMAEGDEERYEIVQRVILRWRCADIATVHYRQAVFRDVRADPERAQAIFALAQESLTLPGQSHQFWLFSKAPSRRLRANTRLLQELLQRLEALRKIGQPGAAFQSTALQQLFASLEKEIDARFLDTAHQALAALQIDAGVRSATVLDARGRCTPRFLHGGVTGPGWLEKIGLGKHEEGGFSIPERDEAGQSALGKLRERLLDQTAEVLDDAVRRVLQFFRLLRDELHFYLGAWTLYQRLQDSALPCCLPELRAAGGLLDAQGLYSPLLPLRGESAVGYDVAAGDKSLLIITGANRGGKTTLLRSIGIAQLWAESGLYVPAKTMSTTLGRAVFSHFQQQEDAALRHGKFAEELQRMSAIVPHLRPGALVLFNESFAATNEQEGSEIAQQVALALQAAGVRVVFVTHLYSFAHAVADQQKPDVLFLRALGEHGATSFQLLPAAPEASSFAAEIFHKVFLDQDL